MRIIRHLVAASAVVALVVALGFAWSHSNAAGLVADGRGDRQRTFATVAPTDRAQGFPLDRLERRGAHGVSLSNVGDLVQTLFAMGAIIGGVIWIDKARRRRNPRIPVTIR